MTALRRINPFTWVHEPKGYDFMKAAIGCFIGLVFAVSASAESLLEGRVRLESGEPVADAQVRIFDMTDLRQGAIARAQTDGRGYFELPLAALGGRVLPAQFALGPNYPNPFNPSTIIPYQLAASSEVRLEVFNLLGQHLVTLVDGERPAGFHTATWHATDGAGRAVGAGVYIYRMTVGVERQTGRMVLIDGQAGVASPGAASVMPGASSVGGSDGAGEQVYGLIVSGEGLAPYVDSSFRVEEGMAPVELVVSAGQHSVGKATDDDCALCGLFDAFNEQQEEEEAEATEEEEETESTSSAGGPDLIVQSPSASAVVLTPGQAFTLNVTVHNQGDQQAAATMLHYYRSNNSTISASDTEVGTGSVDALDASATSAQSIALTASVGVERYYGACVASVDGESNTDNNCSTAVKISVSGQETPEEEEGTSEEEKADETGEGNLIVSASVNDNILTTEQAFILRATVQNQGTDESPEFVLSYYRSSNETISTRDTRVSADEMGSLAASSIRNESIRLMAPSTSGTYHYGACVASVSGGSDIHNSCSSGVSVIVEEEDGADGQDEDLVFTDPQIYNDNVFVLPVTENLVGGNLPYQDYAARFYEHFEDEFDFLIFISNIQEPDQGSLYPFAAHIGVKNDVQGIGLDNFFNDRWVSAGKLQSVIFFQYFGVWGTHTSLGALIHELMHRWANFILPPYPSDPHWGFINQKGWLGGNDWTEVNDLGDGTFRIITPLIGPLPVYSPIELYVAGFIPPEDVPDITIAEVIRTEDGKYISYDVPSVYGGVMTASGLKTYTIEDIIAEHGPRVPDHTQAQKDFRAAVILLVSEEFPVDPVILNVVSDEMSYLGSLSEDTDDGLRMNFFVATGGRGAITMDDLSHFQRRGSAKRLVPSSFGTPPPPIVDVGNARENLGRTWRPIPAEEE